MLKFKHPNTSNNQQGEDGLLNWVRNFDSQIFLSGIGKKMRRHIRVFGTLIIVIILLTGCSNEILATLSNSQMITSETDESFSSSGTTASPTISATPLPTATQTPEPLKITPLFTALEYNFGTILDIELVAEGRYLITSGWQAMEIWDTSTWKIVQSFADDHVLITPFAMSTDGSTLALGILDPYEQSSKLILWDVATSRIIQVLQEYGSPIRDLDFSSDGKLLVSGDEEGSIKYWDLSGSEAVLLAEGHSSSAVSKIEFSPTGDRLFIATVDGILELWSAQYPRMKTTLSNQKYQISDIVFSSDGQMLASGSVDGTIVIFGYDLVWTEIQSINSSEFGQISSLAFSPDGHYLAEGTSSGDIILWDVSTLEVVWKKDANIHSINGITFSVDGQSLISASDELIVWNTSNGEKTVSVKSDAEPAYDLAFSPDGKNLVLIRTNTIEIRDGQTYEEVQTINTGFPTMSNPVFSSDGATFSTTAEKTIYFWDPETWKQVSTLTIDDGQIIDMAYSPDGKFFATRAANGLISLWSITSKTKIKSLAGNNRWPGGIAISPDGDFLVSGTPYDGGTLWDLESGNQRSLEFCYSYENNSVVFSPNGEMVFCSTSGGQVSNVGVTNNMDVIDFAPNYGCWRTTIRVAAFSPDGKIFAFSCESGISFFSLASKKSLGVFLGNPGAISSFVFSPDGKSIVCISDNSILVWSTKSIYEKLSAE